jgi:hypothetical protein
MASENSFFYCVKFFGYYSVIFRPNKFPRVFFLLSNSYPLLGVTFVTLFSSSNFSNYGMDLVEVLPVQAFLLASFFLSCAGGSSRLLNVLCCQGLFCSGGVSRSFNATFLQRSPQCLKALNLDLISSKTSNSSANSSCVVLSGRWVLRWFLIFLT